MEGDYQEGEIIWDRMLERTKDLKSKQKEHMLNTLS